MVFGVLVVETVDVDVVEVVDVVLEG